MKTTLSSVLSSVLFSAMLIVPTGAVCQEPARGEAPATDRNVVLVTMDGLRWQELFRGADPALLETIPATEAERASWMERFGTGDAAARRAALLPFIWSVIAAGGQIHGNVDAGSEVIVENSRLFSYPGYNEILAGAPDERIDSNAKRPNENVTVLEWLAGRPGFEGRVAAFSSWDVFPYIINEERAGIPVNGGFEPADDEPLSEAQRLLNAVSRDLPETLRGVRYDALTFQYALEHVRKHRPRVLYVAPDETDSWAHEGRYDRYLEAAQRFDRFLGTLWEMLQSMEEYRELTTLIVTSDHGRGESDPAWKNHGAGVDGADRIWMAFLGPDTRALGAVEGGPRLTQGQTAATVAAAVGEDFVAAFPSARPPVAAALAGRSP